MLQICCFLVFRNVLLLKLTDLHLVWGFIAWSPIHCSSGYIYSKDFPVKYKLIIIYIAVLSLIPQGCWFCTNLDCKKCLILKEVTLIICNSVRRKMSKEALSPLFSHSCFRWETWNTIFFFLWFSKNHDEDWEFSQKYLRLPTTSINNQLF